MINGIDVSHHQGEIDWKQVKNAGIEFAIIRTGYGKINPNQVDKKFKQNIDGAKSAGIKVGVYHYSYASSPLDASKEAAFCLDIIKGYELEYPVAYDIEDASIAKFTKRQKTDMVKSFCDKIEMSGYYSMVYCNANWINNHLYAEEILHLYDLWLAHYGVPEPSKHCGIWQKSSTGTVSGIKGNVDLNVAYKDYPRIIKNKGLNGYSSSKSGAIHIVSIGETLWGISTKYLGDGTKWKEIQKYNNLISDTIYPGQIIRIPNK